MNETLINDVVQGMLPYLDNAQLEELQFVLQQALLGKEVIISEPADIIEQQEQNNRLKVIVFLPFQ